MATKKNRLKNPPVYAGNCILEMGNYIIRSDGTYAGVHRVKNTSSRSYSVEINYRFYNRWNRSIWPHHLGVGFGVKGRSTREVRWDSRSRGVTHPALENSFDKICLEINPNKGCLIEFRSYIECSPISGLLLPEMRDNDAIIRTRSIKEIVLNIFPSNKSGMTELVDSE